MYILFVTFYSLFMFCLQVDIVGPLLSYVTELIDIDVVFWVLTIVWLNNIELTD